MFPYEKYSICMYMHVHVLIYLYTTSTVCPTVVCVGYSRGALEPCCNTSAYGRTVSYHCYHLSPTLPSFMSLCVIIAVVEQTRENTCTS